MHLSYHIILAMHKVLNNLGDTSQLCLRSQSKVYFETDLHMTSQCDTRTFSVLHLTTMQSLCKTTAFLNCFMLKNVPHYRLCLMFHIYFTNISIKLSPFLNLWLSLEIKSRIPTPRAHHMTRRNACSRYQMALTAKQPDQNFITHTVLHLTVQYPGKLRGHLWEATWEQAPPETPKTRSSCVRDQQGSHKAQQTLWSAPAFLNPVSSRSE